MNRKSFYTLSEASKELGIHPDTLIRWEKLGKISPKRNSLGWRLYTLSDINKAKQIILPQEPSGEK